MARPLSQAEIEQLTARLQADGVAIGWLRPWLWRLGWMAPPPRFMTVNSDATVRVMATAALVISFGFVEALWLSATLEIALMLLKFVHMCWRKWRQGDRWQRQIFRLGCMMALAGSLAFLCRRPMPSPGDILPQLRAHIGWLLLAPLAVYPYHANARLENPLPPWRDYLPAALAVEAF